MMDTSCQTSLGSHGCGGGFNSVEQRFFCSPPTNHYSPIWSIKFLQRAGDCEEKSCGYSFEWMQPSQDFLMMVPPTKTATFDQGKDQFVGGASVVVNH